MARYYWTTAPADYDYSYVVDTRERVIVNKRTWRRVTHTDEERFETYQRPRYASGLHPCFEEGSPDAEYLRLRSYQP